MAGQYASAGLRLEFHPTAALIDCGEAHVLRPYAVENLADRIVVTINNAGGAVPLTLQGDGALAGSGAIDVAGRVVTGTDANGAIFATRNVRCAVGVLAAR